MKKLMNFSGIIGVVGLVGSSIFKLLHLMGAPTLLLVGTIGLGLYILLFVLHKILNKAA